MPGAQLEALRRYWWTFALRGACAVVFGFVAWFRPALTILALLFVWAAFAIANGVTTLAVAFTRDGASRSTLLLEGGASLLAGLVALFYPRLSALLFMYLLAAWGIFAGLMQVLAASRLRREMRGGAWLGFAGALSLLFGVGVLLWPKAGALTLIWFVASFAVLYGVVLIAWGLHLRRLPPHATS
jgi:uncharacterized membrane protein HdeD (DUF308 family)